MAARMREARDRAQRVPESGCRPAQSSARAQRLDAVALPVHRVPQRNQQSRFGEQQKQHSIHDRQRLLEAVL